MQYGQIVSPDGHGLKRLTSLLQSLFVCAARGIGLNESGVRSKYHVTVVGVKSPGKPFRYAEADTVVTNHDLIIVSGTNSDIERFASLDR